MKWCNWCHCYNAPPCWRYTWYKQNWVQHSMYENSYDKIMKTVYFTLHIILLNSLQEYERLRRDTAATQPIGYLQYGGVSYSRQNDVTVTHVHADISGQTVKKVQSVNGINNTECWRRWGVCQATELLSPASGSANIPMRTSDHPLPGWALKISVPEVFRYNFVMIFFWKFSVGLISSYRVIGLSFIVRP